MTEFTSIDDFMNIDDSTLDFFNAPSATSGNKFVFFGILLIISVLL